MRGIQELYHSVFYSLDARVSRLTAFNTVLYDANSPQNGCQESMLSIPHMLVVFVIVLVVFGPQKLPELARSLGKLMAEFRKASSDFKGAFEEEMRDLERQAREVERKKAADAAAKAADEAPVQEATFGTPAGTETPMSEAESAGGLAASEAADTRTTEGSADLVVTPVAESVARSAAVTENAPDLAETNGGSSTKTISETVTEPISQSSPQNPDSSVNVTHPHDQQPA
jgi:sec-independent protein translocase protein TatB